MNKAARAGYSKKAHTPCVGAHVFIWMEAAAQGPPEGLGCNCGMFELHYGTCACGCGSPSMSLGWLKKAPKLKKIQSRKQE